MHLHEGVAAASAVNESACVTPIKAVGADGLLASSSLLDDGGGGSVSNDGSLLFTLPLALAFTETDALHPQSRPRISAKEPVQSARRDTSAKMAPSGLEGKLSRFFVRALCLRPGHNEARAGEEQEGSGG